jgi:hypothetical protein
MADKSADPAFDADEIAALFNKAKAQGGEFTFAFGLTQKPEECALLVHLRKPGKALKNEVKALPGKIGKTCFGTFTVAEGEVRFLSERPAKGMIKALKKRFRDAGMAKFKPMLVGPDGLEIDEDTLPDDMAEDDEDGPAVDVASDASAEAGTQETPAQDLTALKRRLAAIVPRVQALPPEMAEKLRQACLIANQQIGKSDAEGANRSMDQIEAVLARVGGGAETPPQTEAPQAPLARLQDALGKLVARIRALPEGDARNMLGGQARDIMALIKDGAVERAVPAIKTLSQDLAAAEQIGGGGPAAPTLDALAVWRDAKEACDVGISALQQKILSFDDPDLRRIAEFGLNGVTDGVQTGLMAALFTYNSTSGADRIKAAATVAARAADARKVLEGDQIIALVEDNPFGVKVDIRGTLGAALRQLEALAA